jgi:hypothetical protein
MSKPEQTTDEQSPIQTTVPDASEIDWYELYDEFGFEPHELVTPVQLRLMITVSKSTGPAAEDRAEKELIPDALNDGLLLDVETNCGQLRGYRLGRHP